MIVTPPARDHRGARHAPEFVNTAGVSGKNGGIVPKHLVRLDCDGQAHYLLWSTTEGVPIAGPFDKVDMRSWLLHNWGFKAAIPIEQMLADADRFGTSDRFFDDRNAWDTLSNNRAGLDGSRLTLDQIVDVLVRGRPNVGGEPS